MSPRAARLLAIPFMLFACVLSAAATLWLLPSEPQPEVTTALRFGTLGIALGGYLAVLGSARKRPAAWRADPERRRLVALPGPFPIGLTAVVVGWAAGTAVTAAGTDGFGPLVAFVLAAGAVLMAAVTVKLLLGHPVLILTPDGITLVRSRHGYSVRWDDLAPETLLPTGRHNPRAPILIERTADGGTRRHVVPADKLHIESGFLMAALRRYIEEPDRRAGIGVDAVSTHSPR